MSMTRSSRSDAEAVALMAQRSRLAVLVVDMVESVRLMQTHESEVIGRWRAFVNEARSSVLPAQGGRLVKSLGDGMLLAFAAAPQAVVAAFALHKILQRGNDTCAPDAAVLLRVGLHVCDVVVDELDVYGAGVNLAARVASLGQPGDTLVSEAARDHLVDGVHAVLVDKGPRFVKHIDEPVRVFAATPVGPNDSLPRQPTLPRQPDLRPALAVVPFSCMPADAQHDVLGHAMADDIIAALARHPGLRVLSRASTGRLCDTQLEPATLHAVLGASFLLTGRYYVLGERIRLNVELCSLPDAAVLWTGSAGAAVSELFAGQDELVPHVVSQVSQQVLAHELKRVRSLPMDSLASYSLFLGAGGLMNSLQAADFHRARDILEHLIERHPRQAAPYAMFARWHVFRSVQGWASDRSAEAAAALAQADRALDIDPRQPMALASAGLVRMNYHNDIGGARRLYEAAIESDPQEGHAWAWKTAVHSFMGEHDQACECAARAIALSPLDPNRFLFESWAAMAELGAGHFEAAVRHAQSSVRLHALHAPSLRILVAALWLDDRAEQARAAAERYLMLQPQARVGPQREPWPGDQPVWNGAFNDALRAAGVPP